MAASGGQVGSKSARSGIAEAADGWPARGHRKHDHTEPDHRQTHEFKYQRVHGNLQKRKRQNCREPVDRMLIFDGWPRVVPGRLGGGLMICSTLEPHAPGLR